MSEIAVNNLVLDTSQQVRIEAAIGDVYRNLITRLSEESCTPDNTPMPMVLEEWPGGRWFRDLGNGTGHLWGFVQVIKPPTLLEINGPMFMSYAATGHIQFRVTQVEGGTELAVRHRAMGMIEDDHRAGVVPGWKALLDHVKQHSQA